ncbi:MAG: thioredoxin family protein [Candidatus Micrarchaeota archaeon]
MMGIMKKYVFTVLAVALLFGAFGCLGGGPQNEPYLVPDKADGYAIFKPSAIISDSDFVKSMSEATGSSFEETLQKSKDDLGFDPYSVTKATIFLNSENSNPDRFYVGMLFEGTFDKQAVIAKLKEKGDLTEEQYEGTTIYKRIAKEQNDAGAVAINSNANAETYLAFVTDKQVAMGTSESVKDCIDVKNGKRKALKDAILDKVAGAVDSGALAFAAVKIPSSFSKTISSGSSGPVDMTTFSKATHVAFSYNKVGTAMTMKASVLFGSANEAGKALDVLDGLLSMARGFTKSGSATETMVKSVKTGTSESLLTIASEFTKETWDKAQRESAESSATGQGQETGGSPSYVDTAGQATQQVDTGLQTETTGSETATPITGDLVEFYGAECPHCQNMAPIVAQVETETGIKFSKLEVWHNTANQQVFQSYATDIEPACGGGLGVPAFFNVKTKNVICGAASKEELINFVKSK